jgi:hypothetical protein
MPLYQSLPRLDSGIAPTRQCHTRLAAHALQDTKLLEHQANIRLEPTDQAEGDEQ